MFLFVIDIFFSKIKYLDMVKIIFPTIMASILMPTILTHIKMYSLWFRIVVTRITASRLNRVILSQYRRKPESAPAVSMWHIRRHRGPSLAALSIAFNLRLCLKTPQRGSTGQQACILIGSPAPEQTIPVGGRSSAIPPWRASPESSNVTRWPVPSGIGAWLAYEPDGLQACGAAAAVVSESRSRSMSHYAMSCPSWSMPNGTLIEGPSRHHVMWCDEPVCMQRRLDEADPWQVTVAPPVSI